MVVPWVALMNTNRTPASAAALKFTLRWYLLMSMPAMPGGGGASETSEATGTSAPVTNAVRPERSAAGAERSAVSPASPWSSTMGVGVGTGVGVGRGVGLGVGLGVGAG